MDGALGRSGQEREDDGANDQENRANQLKKHWKGREGQSVLFRVRSFLVTQRSTFLFRLVWITCCLGTDLQTERPQDTQDGGGGWAWPPGGGSAETHERAEVRVS